MPGAKIAHLADWHLGPARSKLDPETGLNARLLDFYRCARFSVEHGIGNGAQIVLHAGDVFNGCRPSPTERRLALDAFGPALNRGIPVVVIAGNHDLPRSSNERNALDLLRDEPGLTIIDRPCLLEAWRDGSRFRVSPPAAPEERTSGDTTALQIACFPWATKQLLLADEANRKLDPGELNLLMREKVMDVLRGLAAQRRRDVPCILLAHVALDTAEAGGQNRLMMLGGDWTLNLHELAALGFDAVLLGHIHRTQVLHQNPIIAYCGSPEAVSFGEEGEDKRYLLWSFGGDACVFEGIPTPYRRFVTLEASADGAVSCNPDELAGAIVRVKVPVGSEVSGRVLAKFLEDCHVQDYQIETQRAEVVRRRAVEVSSEMALEEAIKAWLEQRPDLKPMAEELIAEARAVEATMGEDRR